MDAARYARIRELFLATEELPPKEQEAYLRVKTGDDGQLFREVLSLLAEHDSESAQIEGERATPVPYPLKAGSTIIPAELEQPPMPTGQTTSRGETAIGPAVKKVGRGKAPSTRRGESTGRGSITQEGAGRTRPSGSRVRPATKKKATIVAPVCPVAATVAAKPSSEYGVVVAGRRAADRAGGMVDILERRRTHSSHHPQ